MNLEAVIKLGPFVRPIQARNGECLVLGTGRHYLTLNTRTGITIARNLINGKFRRN